MSLTPGEERWIDRAADVEEAEAEMQRDAPVRRSPFLQKLHDAGLDDLVLEEDDPRLGVMVSQEELLKLLDLIDRRLLILTDAEHEVVRLLGDVWNRLCHIVGNRETRDADLTEMAHHVHALQNAVLAQAAARCYPSRYRKLGSTL